MNDTHKGAVLAHHLLTYEGATLRTFGPYTMEAQRRAYFEFRAMGRDVFYADLYASGALHVGRMHEEFRS